MKDDNHLNAVDALLGTLKEMYDKQKLYVNGPLSLRFSSPLSQFLSMANNDEGIPTCYVEMAILYHVSLFVCSLLNIYLFYFSPLA